MYRRVQIHRLEDFWLPLSSRSEKGVYFYRFFRYSEEIRRFIELYLKQAKQCGVVLLGKLPNPNEKQLDYYEEIMGKDFRPDKEFVAAAMKDVYKRQSLLSPFQPVASFLPGTRSLQADLAPGAGPAGSDSGA